MNVDPRYTYTRDLCHLLLLGCTRTDCDEEAVVQSLAHLFDVLVVSHHKRGAQPLVRKLGPPVMPFYPVVGEGSPTTIDYRKKSGTLILTVCQSERKRSRWR